MSGEPTLKVESNPLRLTVVTPPDLPSGRVVRVVANKESTSDAVLGPRPVKVVATGGSVSIFWEKFLIAVATELSPDTVHVHVDFRPIGLNVFDDATGLHVGGMHFVNSGISKAAVAFALG